MPGFDDLAQLAQRESPDLVDPTIKKAILLDLA